MKTQEQKDLMVENLKKLKEALPEFNMFGTDNHGMIEAQISIIKGEAEVSDYEGEDECCDAACQAEDWLNGELKDEDLFNPEDLER